MIIELKSMMLINEIKNHKYDIEEAISLSEKILKTKVYVKNDVSPYGFSLGFEDRLSLGHLILVAKKPWWRRSKTWKNLKLRALQEIWARWIFFNISKIEIRDI